MTGIDAAIDATVRPAADALAKAVFFAVPVAGAELPLVVVWLVAGAVSFTIRFRFVDVRGFAHALSLLRDGSGGAGEVSHPQALSTAVSGTVGIGNIGGVAVAVSLGGPGAAFWRVVAGLGLIVLAPVVERELRSYRAGARPRRA